MTAATAPPGHAASPSPPAHLGLCLDRQRLRIEGGCRVIRLTKQAENPLLLEFGLLEPGLAT